MHWTFDSVMRSATGCRVESCCMIVQLRDKRHIANIGRRRDKVGEARKERWMTKGGVSFFVGYLIEPREDKSMNS